MGLASVLWWYEAYTTATLYVTKSTKIDDGLCNIKSTEDVLKSVLYKQTIAVNHMG